MRPSSAWDECGIAHCLPLQVLFTISDFRMVIKSHEHLFFSFFCFCSSRIRRMAEWGRRRLPGAWGVLLVVCWLKSRGPRVAPAAAVQRLARACPVVLGAVADGAAAAFSPKYLPPSPVGAPHPLTLSPSPPAPLPCL